MQKNPKCPNSHKPPTVAKQAFSLVSSDGDKIFEKITRTSRTFLIAFCRFLVPKGMVQTPTCLLLASFRLLSMSEFVGGILALGQLLHWREQRIIQNQFAVSPKTPMILVSKLIFIEIFIVCPSLLIYLTNVLQPNKPHSV